MVDKCNKCGERHPEKECPNRKSEDKMKYELFEERLKRIEKRIGISKNDHHLERMLAGYHCIFVGKPSLSTPYAVFATNGQAKIFKKEISSKYKIKTFEEWRRQYKGKVC